MNKSEGDAMVQAASRASGHSSNMENVEKIEEKEGRWSMDEIIHGVTFFIVVVNVVQMGACAHCEVEDCGKLDIGCVVLEHIFTFTFLLEAMYEFSCQGRKYFKESGHLFDFGLMLSGVIGTWIVPLIGLLAGGSADEPSGYAVILRVFRLLRILRVVRVMNRIPNLHMILEGMIMALKGMIWVAVLLLLIIYCAAVFGVMFFSFIEEGPEGPYTHFDSLPRALWTMFTVAIAAEWTPIVEPVVEAYWWGALFWAGFIFVASLGALNLIIGVITERTAAVQHEYEIKAKESADEEKMFHLADFANVIFKKEKQDLLEIDQESLRLFMATDFKTIEPRLKTLIEDMNLPEGWHLADFMNVFDKDGSEQVSKEEFLAGMRGLLLTGDQQQTYMLMKGIATMSMKLRIIDDKIDCLAGRGPWPEGVSGPPGSSDKKASLRSGSFNSGGGGGKPPSPRGGRTSQGRSPRSRWKGRRRSATDPIPACHARKEIPDELSAPPASNSTEVPGESEPDGLLRWAEKCSNRLEALSRQQTDLRRTHEPAQSFGEELRRSCDAAAVATEQANSQLTTAQSLVEQLKGLQDSMSCASAARVAESMEVVKLREEQGQMKAELKEFEVGKLRDEANSKAKSVAAAPKLVEEKASSNANAVSANMDLQMLQADMAKILALMQEGQAHQSKPLQGADNPSHARAQKVTSLEVPALEERGIEHAKSSASSVLGEEHDIVAATGTSAATAMTSPEHITLDMPCDNKHKQAADSKSKASRASEDTNDIFQELDADGDGKLSVNEIKAGLQRLKFRMVEASGSSAGNGQQDATASSSAKPSKPQKASKEKE